MISFDLSQKHFANALSDPDLAPPADIASRNGALPQRRFNVYRNNVYAGLIGVLEARYPAVQRLVGDEFFRAMARIFIDRSPPRSPVLLAYGRNFPRFLKAFELVRDVPYLPDVAHLEWKLHVARHAADTPALPIGKLSAYGDAATNLQFLFAPAVSLVTSDYPVFSLWQANATPALQAGPATFAGAESVLISRPALVPEAIRIPRGCAAFIAGLLDRRTLGEAASAAFEAQPDFPLTRTLALLATQKAIASVSLQHPTQEDTRP